MMPGQQQHRPTELDELSIVGPFGGIQSQCALSQIEDTGFQDANNILFYNGQTFPRQTLRSVPIAGQSGEITGIFDFYNYAGIRITGAFLSNGGVFQWNSGSSSWVLVPPANALSAITQLVSWTVVAGKLCFSQGTDPIKLWDGVNPIVQADGTGLNGVPAFHLGELNNHLIICPTIEAGKLAPQRLRWSGAGDPTDWTSFNAGQTDLFNDLGPINNWKKIYQQGYIFQQWGITQQIITGNGLVPFDFVPLSSRSKGLYYPYSVSGFGEFAIYVGKDNVYTFDGSASHPIGDQPMQGKSWIGARDRILGDLLTNGNPNNVYGYYTTSSNGKEFETYILVIPGASVWIYNMKEANWTRVSLTEITPKPTCIGSFYTGSPLMISQLVGPINSQNYTWASLAASASPLDSIAFGGDSGAYIGLLDFSGSPVQCNVMTGSLQFGDSRHSKNVRHVRFKVEALSAFDITIYARNEQGQTEQEYYTIGANPGTSSYQVLPFHIPGVFITMTITFNTTLIGMFRCSEISIGYDTGAEVRTQ
jgi:hypothetical protein